VPVAFKHPWIEARRAPLYVWTLPNAPQDAELATFVEAFAGWIAGLTAPYALVIDGSHLVEATAKQRKTLSQLIADVEPDTTAWCAGTAIVVNTGFARGVVTAVTWLTRPSFPHEVFTAVPEALEWSARMLADSREVISPND
jgi:hypothetical protein